MGADQGDMDARFLLNENNRGEVVPDRGAILGSIVTMGSWVTFYVFGPGVWGLSQTSPSFWEGYGTDTPWQRHDYARHPSGNTAVEGSAQRISRAAPA